MASRNLWALIGHLKASPVITPRQAKKLLRCTSRKSNDLLRYLEQKGAVVNIGKPRHPEYRLKHNGEQKIQPLPIKSETTSVCEQANAVTDICRQNWAGYQIHKVFGSTRA